MLLNTLFLALRSIRRNLLRSFLTVLGIVIGVSAVITMVTLGNGATQAVQMQMQISSLGSEQTSGAAVCIIGRRVSGNQRVNTLLVSMADGSDSASLKTSLRGLLRERRKLQAGDDDNFNILDTQQLAKTLSGTTQVMTMLLGAVAAVSLLVGGIGIMNFMLVSVTERTREIGLRLAIGA